ncbi:MAG: branched-chain amino acid ABC transporter permease [Geminicoccaceae bacterium]
MFYLETGQYRTSYQADQQLFPLVQDRVGMVVILLIAFLAIPMLASNYFLVTIMLPFLVFSVAAIGLNILTGYAGQLSLGTGGFMACGAFAAYKLATAFGWMPIPVVFLLAGGITAMVGVLFGLPSLRIKGFYLAVATLAAQFFLLWLFNKFPWFTNYSASGVISAPPRTVTGLDPFYVTGSGATPEAKYLFALTLTVLLAIVAKNLIRCRMGRSWMAIRDMDIAAEIIGISPMKTKLTAFAVSSFYCGVAGAMWAFIYTSTVEALAFEINVSFRVLFMIIIGGLGSILGSFLGAAFIVLLPIILNQTLLAMGMSTAIELASHLELMIMGALIIFFLIVEPHGFSRLWQTFKSKLRTWPFPY